MEIAYVQSISLIDFPDTLSAIVFTQGCNLHCPYCQNPDLIRISRGKLSGIDVLKHLSRISDKIEGVSITGGEPTIQKDLISFCKAIKDLDLKVKIDTNGSNPKMIRELLDRNILDYIAMDFKAPLSKYQEVTRSSVRPSRILKSAKAIMGSSIPYEFRTTVAKELLSLDDIVEISKILKGARLYVVQKVRSIKTLSHIPFTPYSDSEFESIRDTVLNYVKSFLVR